MKYIIELEKIEGTELFKARGANTLVFDNNGINNILKPYAEPMEHDGCVGCKYEWESANEEPCKDCKGTHRDLYEPMPKKKRWEKYDGDCKQAYDDFMKYCLCGTTVCSNCRFSSSHNAKHDAVQVWLEEEV